MNEHEQQVVALLVAHGFKARLWGTCGVFVSLFIDGEPEAHASAVADLLNEGGWSATISWSHRDLWIEGIHRYYSPPVVELKSRYPDW